MTVQPMLVKRKVLQLSALLSLAALSACQTEPPASDLHAVDPLIQEAATQVEQLERALPAGSSAAALREAMIRTEAQLLLRLEALEKVPGEVRLTSGEGPRALHAERVRLQVSSRLNAASQPAILANEIVKADAYEFSVDSEDCIREPAIEVWLDPEVTHIYELGTVTAICRDATGTKTAKGVNFRKLGANGTSFVDQAIPGSTGAPVGAKPATPDMGASCGEAGADGVDGAGVPELSNTGGDGMSGLSGGDGGSVKPTFFVVKVSASIPLSFEATGGDGGAGQDGGDGGRGGLGQEGGNGADGREACCYGTCNGGTCNLETVKPAGAGGVGGDGGGGGSGGNGGRGGSGGDGGRGGTIFALIEAASYPLVTVSSVAGGRAGLAGAGGAAGPGGQGGLGGYGGRAGISCQFTQGAASPAGLAGDFGAAGVSGSAGADGQAGSRGKSQIIPTTAALAAR